MSEKFWVVVGNSTNSRVGGRFYTKEAAEAFADEWAVRQPGETQYVCEAITKTLHTKLIKAEVK